MKPGKYLFSLLLILAFISSGCSGMREQQGNEQQLANQPSKQTRSTQSAENRTSGLPRTGADRIQETVETPTPTATSTPQPTEQPEFVIVDETIFASQILGIPLVTEGERVIETTDLLGDSGIWEVRYIIVTELDGDHIPVPLAAMEIFDIDPADGPGIGDEDLVFSTELSAEEIDNSPSFASKDVEALLNTNPRLLQLMGVDNWDELASEHWLDKVEIEPIPEGESGYPILMSGDLIEGEEEGIDFPVVNSNGDLLGIVVDFVINPERQILHAVLDMADAGITIIPIQLVSADIENHQLVVPVELALLADAPTFESLEELPDISESGWDSEIFEYWKDVVEKNDR